MTLVRPVPVHVVTPEWAPRVVSPLHDVLTEDERRAVLADNRDSYLHVTSDPADVPGTHGEPAAEAGQALALRRLLDRGAYRRLPAPGVFVYRMRDQGEEHTGVVAGVDLAGFADGRVLGHERVQASRVESLLRHHERVTMRSELVALFHRADPVVAELTTRVRQGAALLEFTDAGGIEQCVWQAGPEEASALAAHLSSHRHYIADGHHRIAAALRSREHDDRRGSTVLCAVYPQDQVSLQAFHRRVQGPVSVPPLLAALRAHFEVRSGAGPEVSPGSIGLYAAGRWRVLVPLDQGGSPGVAGLDVTVLEDRVLRPLLGVQDGDPRLDFIPALRDLEPTLRACDADGGVLFTLRAPDVGDVMQVAERHEVMSAKSTYVRPKPRTGLFLH